MEPNAQLAQALEQLRDAHAPATIEWWPPAIGWWILALLVITFLVFAIRAIIKHRRKTAWRRTALKEYQDLKKRYAASPGTEQLTHIIVLLKRCSATIKNDRRSLSATGEHWQTALASSPNSLNDNDIQILSNGHYQPEAPLLDQHALKRIETWIKRLPA